MRRSPSLRARQLLADGKAIKILTVGKKGNDIQLIGRYIVDHVRSALGAHLAVARGWIAEKVLKLLHDGEFDVCRIVLRRVQVRQ